MSSNFTKSGNKAVNRKMVEHLTTWFYQYTSGFNSDDNEYNDTINLKTRHTGQVVRAILDIGDSLNLSMGEKNLAECCALFHDIGRYEQYDRYGTYVDSISEDHGLLGVQVLQQQRVLEDLEADISELIMKTVKYHNRIGLPDNEDVDCLFFTKLVRDADKLDIFNLVSDHYLNRGDKPNRAIELELPDNPEISEKVFQDLLNGKTVNMNDVISLNDFKLLQIGWVNDLNFAFSRKTVKKKKHIKTILNTIHKSNLTDKIKVEFSEYL